MTTLTSHGLDHSLVDLGYRGVDADNPDVHIVHRGKAKRISEQQRKLLRRRHAIEPIIGHLKASPYSAWIPPPAA